MYSAISYYTLLLLIIIFYLYLLFLNISNVPKKIKPYTSIFIILAIFKNVFIVILAFSKSGFNITLSKSLILLDIIYIPALIITLFYIFWRSDKLKYSKVISLSLVFVALYVLCVILFKGKFDISYNIGYYLTFDKNILLKVIVSLIYIVFLILLVYSGFNKSTNSIGIKMLIICVSILILDNLSMLVITSYLPYSLISEITLMISLCYGFRTFKS